MVKNALFVNLVNNFSKVRQQIIKYFIYMSTLFNKNELCLMIIKPHLFTRGFKKINIFLTKHFLLDYLPVKLFL